MSVILVQADWQTDLAFGSYEMIPVNSSCTTEVSLKLPILMK